MIDLEQLKIDREKASEDKAELFDFYHKNWNVLIKEIESLNNSMEHAVERINKILRK